MLADVHHHVDSTAYCLTGRMANGHHTHERAAASNTLRLGTKIRLVGRVTGPNGRRLYTVTDRIGHGTSLDLWVSSCDAARAFGRRQTSFKLGWGKR